MQTQTNLKIPPSEVIGPFSKEEWFQLKSIREAIDYFETLPDPDFLFRRAIQHNQDIFRYIVDENRSRH